MLNVPARAPTVKDPARDVVFSDVEEKAAELYEVWCLVSEAGRCRGWQSLTLVLCPVGSRELGILSPAWPCCPGQF